MTILVVGSAGYVGRAVLSALRDAGREVAGADRRKLPGLVDHELELADPQAVNRVLAEVQPSAVVNMAYLRSVDSDADPQRAIEVNLLGVNGLFLACRAQGISRLVFASSTAVYGDPDLFDDNVEIEEDAFPRWPRGLYGWMKQLNEGLAERYNADGPTQFVSVRLGSMQGGRKGGIFDPMDRLVDGFVDSRPVTLPWSRNHRFGFVHVNDAADAVRVLATAPAVRHPVYNLGATAVSMMEFADIARQVDSSLTVDFEEPGRRIRHVSRVGWSRLAQEFQLQRPTVKEWIEREVASVSKMSPEARNDQGQQSSLASS
jgi:UDP-glucose 4-epimerase